MSNDTPRTPDGPDPTDIRPLHYQIVCTVALGLVFLVLLQDGLLVSAAMVLLLGAAAVLLRVRISPILVVAPLVAGELYRFYSMPAFGSRSGLHAEDVLLCAATLAYVVGHYRLI